MPTLTELMREATELAPAPPRRGDEAITDTWRRGKRRNIIRYAAPGAAVAAILAFVATLLVSPSGLVNDRTLPADRDAKTPALTYPENVGSQLVITDLPDRPGPMVALTQVSSGESARWQAISPSGRRYYLPFDEGDTMEIYPVMSSDGTRIAYYQRQNDRMIVHDLVSGSRWVGLQLGHPWGPGRTTTDGSARDVELQQQSPGFFSPNNRYLALLTSQGPVVYDVLEDEVSPVQGMSQAAGWLDDDRFVGRVISAADASSGSDVQSVDGGVFVNVWDRRTSRTEPLGEVPFPGDTGPFTAHQWWGSVRGDGTLWVTVSREDGADEVMSLGGFMTSSGLQPIDRSGTVLEKPEWVEAPTPLPRALAWHGDNPVMKWRDLSLWGSVNTFEDFSRLTSVSGPGSGPDVMWAAEAFNGSPTATDFLDAFVWWRWDLKRVVVVLLIVGAGVLWWRSRRRRSVAE